MRGPPVVLPFAGLAPMHQPARARGPQGLDVHRFTAKKPGTAFICGQGLLVMSLLFIDLSFGQVGFSKVRIADQNFSECAPGLRRDCAPSKQSRQHQYRSWGTRDPKPGLAGSRLRLPSFFPGGKVQTVPVVRGWISGSSCRARRTRSLLRPIPVAVGSYCAQNGMSFRFGLSLASAEP